MSSVAASWSLINPARVVPATRFVQRKLGVITNAPSNATRVQQRQPRPPSQPAPRKFCIKNHHQPTSVRRPFDPFYAEKKAFSTAMSELMAEFFPHSFSGGSGSGDDDPGNTDGDSTADPFSVADAFEAEAKRQKRSEQNASRRLIDDAPLRVSVDAPPPLVALVRRMNFILHCFNDTREPATVQRPPRTAAVPTDAQAVLSDTNEECCSFYRSGPNEAAATLLVLLAHRVPVEAPMHDAPPISVVDGGDAGDAVDEHPNDSSSSNNSDGDGGGTADNVGDGSLGELLLTVLCLIAIRSRGRMLLPPLRVAVWLYVCSSNISAFIPLRPALSRTVLHDPSSQMAFAELTQLANATTTSRPAFFFPPLGSSSSACSVRDFLTFSRRFPLSPRIIVGGLHGGVHGRSLHASIEQTLADAARWILHAADGGGGGGAAAQVVLLEQLHCAGGGCGASEHGGGGGDGGGRACAAPVFALIQHSVRVNGAAWTVGDLPRRILAALEKEVPQLDAEDCTHLFELMLVYGQRTVSRKEREAIYYQRSPVDENGGSEEDAVHTQLVLHRVQLVASLAARLHQHQQQQQRIDFARRVLVVLQHGLGSSGMMTSLARRLLWREPALQMLVAGVLQRLEDAVSNDQHEFIALLEVCTSSGQAQSAVAERMLARRLLWREPAQGESSVSATSNDNDDDDAELLAQLDGSIAAVAGGSAEQRQQLQHQQESLSAFLTTPDVDIWSRLVAALLALSSSSSASSSSGTQQSQRHQPLPLIVTVPQLLRTIVQNGADLASRGAMTTLRELTLFARLVGFCDAASNNNSSSSRNDAGAAVVTQEQLAQLVAVLDATLLDIVAAANDKIRERSQGEPGRFQSGGLGTVGAASHATSKTAPPLPAADILAFLVAVSALKRARLKHLSLLEPLARDALGHFGTPMHTVLDAMTAFLAAKEEQLAQQAREREEQLEQDAGEQPQTSAAASSASPSVFFGDHLLLSIVAERLVPLHLRSRNGGAPVAERLFAREYLLPIMRFLVIATSAAGTSKRSSSSDVSFGLALERMLLENKAAERVELKELPEIAALALHCLHVPLDGEFAASVLDRWREALACNAFGVDDLAGLERVAKIARHIVGRDTFAVGEIAQGIEKCAVDAVNAM